MIRLHLKLGEVYSVFLPHASFIAQVLQPKAVITYDDSATIIVDVQAGVQPA